MTDWLILLLGVTVTGAALAYAMAVPHRWLPVPVLLIPAGVACAARSLRTLFTTHSAGVIGMAVMLTAVGVSAGYWLAAASTLSLGRPRDTSLVTRDFETVSGATVILLSFAAPTRYRIGRTASHVRRLIESDALHLPTSALPFIFLSERARYRAIGDYLPARASVVAVAEEMDALLGDSASTPVLVAWSDGSPSLRESVGAAMARGSRSIVILTLGGDGSYLSTEARLDLERAGAVDATHRRIVFAPSIWHSEDLANRLVARVLEPTVGARLDDVGVVLVGAGQPAAWESLDQGWRERENYFNQRVRLLLTERGISETHVRTAWLEWQTPDVTESVRHLAALGCTRIIVAPSTIVCTTLATAIDLEHMVTLARVVDTVHTVTLPPWGDDPALVGAAVNAVRRAVAGS